MLVDPTSSNSLLLGTKGLQEQVTSTRKYLKNRAKAVYDAHKQPVPPEYAPSADDLVDQYRSPKAQ
jgi:hypothetical protein